MAHLIAYAQMSTSRNSLAEVLIKAQCDFCGKKFGSLEEAKECESNHLQDFVGNSIKEALKIELQRRII